MNVYDFKVKNQKGEEVSLDQYKGKVLLIVNTATKCGLTPQYDELEALYKDLHDKGFELLDFPSNQFLEQAPGSADDINAFCKMHFGTTFPRFQKIDVNGEDADPLFKWLKEEKPEATENDASLAFEEKVKQYTPDNQPADIKWNFNKFLIDKDGNVVARFAPAYDLDEVKKTVEKYL